MNSSNSPIMNSCRQIGVVIAGAILAQAAFASTAFALDELIKVKPGDSHVSVKAEKTKIGHIRFTISRDASKNPDQARRGWLTLSSDAGFLAECAVDPAVSQPVVTYTFDMAETCVQHSSFLLHEYRQPKEGGELQLGGATMFEIRLADFVGNAPDSERSLGLLVNPVGDPVFPNDASQADVDSRETSTSQGRAAKAESLDVRQTAVAFLAAAVAGRNSSAVELTGPRPIEPREVSKLTDALAMTSVTSDIVESVYATKKDALAVTKEIHLPKSGRAVPTAGYLVFRLINRERRWYVSDVDFESHPGAVAEVRRFVEQFPSAQQIPSQEMQHVLNRLVRPEFTTGWEVFKFPFDETQPLDNLNELRKWMIANPESGHTDVEIEAQRLNLRLKVIELNRTLNMYPTGPVHEAALPLNDRDVSEPIPYGKFVLLVRRIGQAD